MVVSTGESIRMLCSRSKYVIVAMVGFLAIAPALADSDKEIIHVTVVGDREDALTRRLMDAGRLLPSDEAVLEQWDRRDPVPRGINFRLPVLPKPAAFVCTATRCSLPLFTPEQLRSGYEQLKDASPQSGELR